MGYYRVQQNWRDHYNPLRGLTLQRILSMEEAAERGDQSDVQWFWDHMHQTDVTVASAVEKRLGYIRSLDWEIRTIETADPWLAHEQEQVLRYAYDRIENLTEAASNLAYANFTGFTMLEKIRTGYSKLIKRLEYIPPWYWNHDPKTDRWLFNPDARPGRNRGEIADRTRLLIHSPMRPLCERRGYPFKY
jgi:phage gp29-like protein